MFRADEMERSLKNGTAVGSETYFGYTTIKPLKHGYMIAVTIPDYAIGREGKIAGLAARFLGARTSELHHTKSATVVTAQYLKLDMAIRVAMKLQVADDDLPKLPDPDMVLSSGRTVRHTREPNGAQLASIVGNPTGEMTRAEWEEYCVIGTKNETAN